MGADGIATKQLMFQKPEPVSSDDVASTVPSERAAIWSSGSVSPRCRVAPSRRTEEDSSAECGGAFDSSTTDGSDGDGASETDSSENAVFCVDVDSEASPEDDSPQAGVAAGSSAGVDAAAVRRCVRFASAEPEVYSITPYSEIYGLHPRLFDLDKGYAFVPAKGIRETLSEITARANAGVTDEDGDSEDDASDSDDEDFANDDWDVVEERALYSPQEVDGPGSNLARRQLESPAPLRFPTDDTEVVWS